ncbi:MAG: pantetheine-phosphate adenylyltransferase [Chloroflexi bacterium]|nr:pantetheine-phosphate adenylyltransferase [Chloroflexota bacterium]
MRATSERRPPTRRAIYPGTFDPPHNGHLDVIRRTARLFDEVIVAVNERTSKTILFETEERVALLQEAVADLPNVRVEPYRGLTVEYASARGACAIVRGLRATGDFEFEYQMALMNRHLRGEIEGVFLMTSLTYAHISSTLVKEIARLGGSLEGLVPDHVAAALARKFQAPVG